MMWEKLISILGGFTVIVGALSYLLSKVIEYYIDKKLEQHKMDIQLNSERIKLAFTFEVDQLKKLWNYILELVEVCGNFKSDENYRSSLTEAIDKLDKFKSENHPYIHPCIVGLLEKLIIVADSDQFDSQYFGEIEKIKGLIINEYHKRFLLDL